VGDGIGAVGQFQQGSGDTAGYIEERQVTDFAAGFAQAHCHLR
jgi:hypothetical protein